MSITLNSVVYNWVGFDPSGASRWTATAGGLATSFSNLTERVTIGSFEGSAKTPRMSKSQWRINIPIVATEVSGNVAVGDVLRTAYFNTTIEFHPTSTSAERADMLARIRALVLTTDFGNSITNLAQSAGT